MEATAISLQNELGQAYLHLEYDEENDWVHAKWMGEVNRRRYEKRNE